jgi:hypothetical protein
MIFVMKLIPMIVLHIITRIAHIMVLLSNHTIMSITQIMVQMF